ncbi:hypothetical protein PVK06_049917 [Gossypium arboreum]|uniref:Uncharacterized protein n=1 Tax=Gossypium arboreum TaxID=29729 RepID=A0ABR0MBD7_GOSAR|nr:hypothetical protein PVK06_049917 [Gossypium arboreum]
MGAVDQVDGFVKRFFLDNFSLLERRANKGTQKDRLATGRKVGIDFEVGVLFPYFFDGKSGLPRLLQCLGESVNGNFLAISEAQGSRGKKARQKGGSPTPERCMKETLESYRSGQESAASYDKALAAV